ncbi:MAG: putative PurR-regulated permease PerM [Natronomonas sp.]|jgi:predicted PurR-regulated permease PerM|uniref:AI-2E family transporter n=1 Tax=Natronomonas sp. TaxID=2184060 RepID=UPI003988F277
MDEKRTIVALFGVAVAVAVGYIAYRFIAALTVSVFLYYSTRRFYKGLRRLRLPARVRAFLVISFLAVPLVLLISYTVVLLIIEARQFVNTYPVIDVAARNITWFEGLNQFPKLSAQGIIEAYRAGQLDVLIDFATENAAFLTNTISSFLLNLLVVAIVTYYLLIDGHKIREWLLRFDEEAIIREYLEAADRELEAVLFGNLLNVIVIALIAIASFNGYNYFVPMGAEVPYPTLAGALTGVASLIPVVGMKVVYVPHAIIAAVGIYLAGTLALLVYVVGYLLVAVIVVDTIPDLVLRPYLSGETTHVGLLMLAYIFGPIVFGFYGLFFAPIILVFAHTFADTALPRLLGSEPKDGLHEDQLRLDEF